jgi:hypothetical protein
MMLSQGKTRRFLAVMLSASFIWTAMACLSLCLLHGSQVEACVSELADESNEASACADESLQAGELLYTNADSCCEPDCCPVKPLPVCILQKSSVIDFQACGDYQISHVHTALRASPRHIHQLQDLLPHSTSDPPLARLCTLRI